MVCGRVTKHQSRLLWGFCGERRRNNDGTSSDCQSFDVIAVRLVPGQRTSTQSLSIIFSNLFTCSEHTNLPVLQNLKGKMRPGVSAVRRMGTVLALRPSESFNLSNCVSPCLCDLSSCQQYPLQNVNANRSFTSATQPQNPICVNFD